MSAQHFRHSTANFRRCVIHTEEGKKLGLLINKAIEDLVVTTSEYEAIMAQANSDGIIDPDEERLLKELQRLISEGIVQRVPDWGVDR